jgi:hypothetical protein
MGDLKISAGKWVDCTHKDILTSGEYILLLSSGTYTRYSLFGVKQNETKREIKHRDSVAVFKIPDYGETSDVQSFPNTFDSWHETHHEFVRLIGKTEDIEGTIANEIQETEGRGGLYIFARLLTDQFEKTYKGREWQGDYFEEIDKFFDMYNKKPLIGYDQNH